MEDLVFLLPHLGLPPSSSRGESSNEDSSSFGQYQNSPTPTPMANQKNHGKPWLNQDVVLVPRPQHPLPKHIEKWLPKFDLDSKQSSKDHI